METENTTTAVTALALFLLEKMDVSTPTKLQVDIVDIWRSGICPMLIINDRTAVRVTQTKRSLDQEECIFFQATGTVLSLGLDLSQLRVEMNAEVTAKLFPIN